MAEMALQIGSMVFKDCFCNLSMNMEVISYVVLRLANLTQIRRFYALDQHHFFSSELKNTHKNEYGDRHINKMYMYWTISPTISWGIKFSGIWVINTHWRQSKVGNSQSIFNEIQWNLCQILENENVRSQNVFKVEYIHHSTIFSTLHLNQHCFLHRKYQYPHKNEYGDQHVN